MTIRTRAAVPFAAIAALFALTACAAQQPTSPEPDAADFPTNEMRLIVTYPAGGPTDLIGRALATSFEEQLGQPVVVENVDGASGAIGMADLASSAPDGHTMAISTNSSASRLPVTQNVAYSLDDVTTVGTVATTPVVLVVMNDSPFDTAEDLFEAARDAPGSITVGTSGAQSAHHIELQRVASEYDTELRLVPFQGDAENLTALLGGNTQVFSGGLTEQILAMVEDGQARVLATYDPDGLTVLPDVPTVASLGFDEIVYGVTDLILYVPADTPEDIVAILETALESAWEDPAVRDVIAEFRMTPEFVGADTTRAGLEEEREVMTPILQELLG